MRAPRFFLISAPTAAVRDYSHPRAGEVNSKGVCMSVRNVDMCMCVYKKGLGTRLDVRAIRKTKRAACIYRDIYIPVRARGRAELHCVSRPMSVELYNRGQPIGKVKNHFLPPADSRGSCSRRYTTHAPTYIYMLCTLLDRVHEPSRSHQRILPIERDDAERYYVHTRRHV